MSELNHYKLEAFFDQGWILSISDINGDPVKVLEWGDFFDKNDEFSTKEMEEMGFEVV